MKSFKQFVIEDSPDAPFDAPPSFTGLEKNPYKIAGSYTNADQVPPEKDRLTKDPGGDKPLNSEGAFEMMPSDEVEQNPSNITVSKTPFKRQ